MAETAAVLFSRLKPDAWRADVGFSPEIDEVNRVLFDPASSHGTIKEVMNAWLHSHQPCLFGRVAALTQTINYCLLDETHLVGPDEGIRDRIQDARAGWKADAYVGKSSAFIILVRSERIARAEPTADMAALAQRLCQLYLVTDAIDLDAIYTDHVELEVPSFFGRRPALMFDVGVNYFCAQGDKRWWADHRIPGGMAFSMNSVGHLVKSGILANAFKEVEREALGVPPEWKSTKIDSLEKALFFAMRTIEGAAQGVSGPATHLLPLPARLEDLPVPKCPVVLPKNLADKNHCTYLGHYHTDYTLPSEYFVPDIERSGKLASHFLDFTYLFDDRLDNPAHFRMGRGIRVRGIEGKETDLSAEREARYIADAGAKRRKSNGAPKK